MKALKKEGGEGGEKRDVPMGGGKTQDPDISPENIERVQSALWEWD